MTRSTELWLISRSCHRATFSRAAMALPRNTRASPVRRSPVMGLRLCGMALEPFWPFAKYSSASSTSVRCRCRNSVAQRSMLAPTMATVVMNSAWMSRCTTCVAIGAGLSPSLRQTYASIFGDRCALVPTAPDSLPMATRGLRVSSRSSARPNSSYIRAILRPKVVGSALMPWLRPIIGVYMCLRALAPMTFRRRLTSAMRILSDSFICTANAVSMMSLLVRPKCSQRLAGLPMFSETLVVKAMTSWFSVRSSSRQRSMVKEALSFICLRCFFGTSPSSQSASAASSSMSSQISSFRCSVQMSLISGRV